MLRKGEFKLSNVKGIDITKNIKMIENLKCSLLEELSELYKLMSQSERVDIKGEASAVISKLISCSYILGKRMGITYEEIDAKIESYLKLEIINENDIESNFNDCSGLIKHLRGNEQ